MTVFILSYTVGDDCTYSADIREGVFSSYEKCMKHLSDNYRITTVKDRFRFIPKGVPLDREYSDGTLDDVYIEEIEVDTNRLIKRKDIEDIWE